MFYSEEILEEVRSRNDIVDVISSYVKLKRSGATYFGLCPFHNEKTPSFSVTPRKQMFYCFGCHRGGSVITFVELYENYSFQEAVQFLAQRAGIALPRQEETPEQRRRTDLRARLLEVNRMAGTFYYYQLHSRQGEIGLNYLLGRGLSEETIKRFGLGYAGKYSDSLYRYLKQKGVSDDLLRQSGLMSVDEKRGMYDKFWNRVMFPIMDVNRRIIGFGGRVMGDGKPKYLNSPESEIFNKRRNLYGLHEARRTRENYLILCEGYMDVIAMHQAGFTNAVASLGTALTEEHAALLRRYTERVILSYDSDEAGVNAALRAIPMLKGNGIDVKVLNLSPYKDPDEMIKAEGVEVFHQRIKEARNSFLFEIDSLKGQFDLSDPDAKLRFLSQVAAKIAEYELEAQRENYIEAAAPVCGIGFDALRQMVNRCLTAGVPARREIRSFRERKTPDRGDGILTSQRLLLSWLTRYPSLYPVLKEYVRPQDYSNELYRETAALLYRQLEAGEISEAAIVDHFTDPEEQNQVAALFHSRLEVESQEELKKAVRETVLKVARHALGAPQEGTEAASIDQLQQMVERKRRLDALSRMQIDLGQEEAQEEEPEV